LAAPEVEARLAAEMLTQMKLNNAPTEALTRLGF
jgi:hypothetical protein